MKSSIGSTACSRTSSAGASASCTDSDAGTWTGSAANGRSDGIGDDRAAFVDSPSAQRQNIDIG